MYALVSSGGSAVHVLTMKICIVVGRKESMFEEDGENLVLDWEDMLLSLVLHSIVALAVVAEENGQPVSGHDERVFEKIN